MDEIHHNISWGKYLLDSTHNPSGQLNVMEFCPRMNEDLIHTMTELFSEFRLEPEVPLGPGIHMDPK